MELTIGIGIGFYNLMLVLLCPQAAQAFLQQSGLQALERHREEAQLQDRILALQQTAIHG